jgi:hypothetical protein
MNTRPFASLAIIAAFLALAGCATSALEEQKRAEMEADVDEILAYELDPAEYGEPKKCLLNTEYVSYRALGKRHLLFKGRQGKQWVNVLRGHCFGLNDNSTFIVRPNVSGRLCDMDRFSVVDRSASLSSAGTAPTCVLGEFRPVTEAQIEEIENRLEMR